MIGTILFFLKIWKKEVGIRIPNITHMFIMIFGHDYFVDLGF